MNGLNQKDDAGIPVDEKAAGCLQRTHDFLETILDAVGVLVMVIDRNGRIIRFNRAGEVVSGYAAEELVGKFVGEILAAPVTGARAKVCFRDGDPVPFAGRCEALLRTKSGETRLMDWSNRVLRNSRGGVDYVVCTGSDITERRRRNDALRQREREFKALVENAPYIIIQFDRDLRITYANPAVERKQGLKPAELIGKTIEEIGIPVRLSRLWRHKLRAVLETGAEETVEFQFGPSRSAKAYHARLAPELTETGDAVSVLCVIRDVTDHKRKERQVNYLSRHDILTGLYKRAYFDREMDRISAKPGGAVGLIVCDVDGLKVVNDSLGLEAGDRLLVSVARHIRSIFRKNDFVARVGGGQFAVILRNGNRRLIEKACRRIREISVWPVANEDMELTVTVSAGFAVGDSAEVDELYREAENNMNREKLHHRTSGRSAVVQALMKALEARDFITEGHGDRLGELMCRMAVRMGLHEQHRIADLRLLGQFHDIGKVGIPDHILFKPGPLTPGEVREMQRHCEIGYRIALSAPDLEPIADWILKHHEWWNGQGYPLGLEGG